MHLPGKLDHVKRLVALCVEFDRPDAEELTPVQAADWEGPPEVMAYFLSLKPDLSHVDSYGGTLLSTIIHGSENCPQRADRDYIGCLELALEAGVALPRRVHELAGDQEVAPFLATGPRRIPDRLWRAALPDFDINELALGNGVLGISPIPGRTGRYDSDLAAILQWGAGLVLTMTTSMELDRVGATGFADDLAAAGVLWRHLPIPDFGAPPPETAALWPEASERAHEVLSVGGRVLAHCYGGCGRSGMALMRLMIEAGEDADPALERLRDVRPCAVEREAQRAWAAVPMFERRGWTP